MCVEGSQYIIGITANDRCHGGRGNCAGFSHGTATFAYEDHCLFRRQDADSRSSGDLAYRVSSNDADKRITVRWMRKKLECGKQTSGNQEWLGDRGISDCFGVGCCAVVRQIEASYCREPIEPVGEGGHLKPGTEKPRCLSTLTRRHYRKHIATISWPGRKDRAGTPRIFGRPIVGFSQALAARRAPLPGATSRRGGQG